jgi:two-component system, OmpR family, alkaline phosphatase synthesis response regulator PhoP
MGSAPISLSLAMSSAARRADPFPMARVLVIEDEPSVARLVQLIVELEGHEVLIADDGSRGFAMAQRQVPDAILLDLMMPIMDGFAALQALREDERTSHIPVVVLSAIAKESAKERCIDLGAQAVVSKPFDTEELLVRLDAAIAGSERVAS